ncbi:VOC family protein [Leucobacter massiliensis]|uniref:Glyoxalase n=1 Tax=Leucobacter massiliensis TaxID=1686285 RepID=A0A2S9QML8_9MICO|nr:VOC family protein [Leucobacter massiliensis]PRI10844.1 glyoxalase [Leucobacter massiliensis]
MITVSMVTIDTADARELARWWADRLGGEVTDEADGWFCMVQAPGSPVALGFQRVEDPTPGKNRVHLDFDRSAEVDRERLVSEWTAAGATHLGRRGEAGFSWDTFADPHGNEFCIGDPH